MSSLDENTLSANSVRMQSVQTLVVGRLIVIFLLLVTSWLWYRGSVDLSFREFPGGPFPIFVVSVGLTAVYFVLLRLSRNLMLQVRVQFLIDSLLVTWLVWRTGDLTSPYITLYIVLIAISSIYLKPGSTFRMALLCVLLFISLAGLTGFSVIRRFGDPQDLSRIIQIVSFHTVAFLVVGLLASRLSERRYSGVQLEEATKTIANLRVLHERIVESIRSGLITSDLEGNIYSFNTAASEITGYSADEMQGRSIYSLFGDIKQSIDLSLGSVETGEPTPRFEADLITPEGFAVRIGYSISQLYSEDNTASGLIITFQDLTEIRSMEESIRRKDRLAAVGRVGAGLAHEIRNPLGAMRGAIQVLEANTPPESIQADLMGIILRESDRLNSIISNFLSYAKPRVGDFTEVDICEAVRETIKLLRHSPDLTPKHELEAALPPLPIFISADTTQLKQVFWNLARNSINAMPGGGKLFIRLETIPNNRIRIEFEDTGVGMSPERVEQLFEPFSNSTTGGTGLGLSIVYQIIRDHNGTINVRSHEGEGTVITIVLPRENQRSAIAEIAVDGQPATASERLKDYLKVENEESKISS